ncbi:MAG: phospho-N-acetylmuramoyl-pentapeptide-transferase [Clostridiaceae bacterium]
MELLFAFLLALAVGITTGPFIIKKLKEFKLGQIIRTEGPQEHLKKQGTPTMGGLIFIIAITISSLIFGGLNRVNLVLVGGMILFGSIGLLDDGLKIKKKDNEGLTAKQKLLMGLLYSIIVALAVWAEGGNAFYLSIPMTKINIGFNLPVMMIFIVVFYTAVTNSVNLADGIDGLCGSITLVVAAFYLFYSIRGGHTIVAIFSAAMCGGLIAYLFFNWHPARVFMGDTGSFALGGALASMAIVTKTELLFILIGLIYVLEALSVIIQVAVFKKTGKRPFRMAPIHHHFEKGGWNETKIVGVFTLFTLITSVVAYLITA